MSSDTRSRDVTPERSRAATMMSAAATAISVVLSPPLSKKSKKAPHSRGDSLNAIDAQLDESLKDYGLLNDLEAKTGVRKSHLLIIGSSFFLAFVFFGLGAGPLCDVIGLIYPIYASFKALEEKNISARTDAVKRWLIYWLVFGFVDNAAVVTDTVLWRFPFYFPLKVFFVLWCLMPRYRGAIHLYDTMLSPFMSKSEKHIDNFLCESNRVYRSIVRTAVMDLREATTNINTAIGHFKAQKNASAIHKNS